MAKNKPFSAPPKKSYTLAAEDKPPILRKNAEGMFMTTPEIEADDARIALEKKNRPSSRPPVNKDESVFPASGWPTAPKPKHEDGRPVTPPPEALLPSPSRGRARMQFPVAPAPSRSLVPVPSFSSYWSITTGVPTPDPRAINPGLRALFPSPARAAATSSSGSGSSDNSSSNSGRGPVGGASGSVPPPPPSPEEPYNGPRGINYNPQTTGLVSAFSPSSSEGSFGSPAAEQQYRDAVSFFESEEESESEAREGE